GFFVLPRLLYRPQEGLGRDAGGIPIRQFFSAPIRIHIWDYTPILRISAIVDNMLISI
ncbi:MAG: hypothetical protein UY78_C0006G0019, partial [Parcubacteria group bacterium GW2011_GWA1_53_13]